MNHRPRNSEKERLKWNRMVAEASRKLNAPEKLSPYNACCITPKDKRRYMHVRDASPSQGYET